MGKEIKVFLLECCQKIVTTLHRFWLIFRDRIKNSYGRCRNGEENFKILLLYWCTVPAAIYMFFRFKFRFWSPIEHVLDIFIAVISSLDIFFIQKALKNHPEYDSEFVKNKEKKDYYASLNDEELETVKSKEKKEDTKNFFKHLLLLNTDKKIDPYKIVRLFIILTLLLALKRLLL
ncbi:MAG: hypothetical protein LBI70_03885 [Rickettsiales bacterium]|jgi:hypothetical protein|nr:hypothetical protein [Rickettsiales bacterium]